MPTRRVAKSNAEKLEVIEWIQANSPSVPTTAAKHFSDKGWKISGAQVRYWWKHREEIKNSSPVQLRLKGGGAKPQLDEIEDVLFDLIIHRRSEKLKVSREWIQSTARDLAKAEGGYDSFVASDKWLAAFMARYDLSLRRTTNLTILTDDELVERAVRYMSFLGNMRSSLDFQRTFLMDETAVYFEDPRRDTVDEVGARHVVLKTTGFASMRITAVLAVTAAGAKFPPLLIWKGKGASKFQRVGNVYITLQEKAWVNSALLIQWLDLVFPSLYDAVAGSKTIVWDSMRAHISKAVKARCAEKKIKSVVIPGGMTPYLQAGDIGIYKSFKDNISPIIDAWKSSDQVLYTKGGNPKPPAVETVARWVERAWKAVPDDVVIKSVRGAGLSENYDDWHIARHDVYGHKFIQKWMSERDDESETELSDLPDEFDELAVDDVHDE